jgi:uracil-DNA glycosylase family 4
MAKKELTLAEKLEMFAKDQASRYGDVISYVPFPSEASTPAASMAAFAAESSTIIEEMPRKKAAATEASNEITITHHGFSELQEKLKVFQSEPWAQTTSLADLEALIQDCHKCRLWETRNKLVFGKGSATAGVMVIGEAPGADEDMQGEPFVGRAGQLLTKMLEAVNFKREDVFIANMLKSRPPNNRDPKPDELEACEPYLWQQIMLIKPKMILCMGRIAAISLLKSKETTLAKIRGNVYDFYGVKVMATYHPAALLRNPDWKRPAWEDLQQFRKLYDELSQVK